MTANNKTMLTEVPVSQPSYPATIAPNMARSVAALLDGSWMWCHSGYLQEPNGENDTVHSMFPQAGFRVTIFLFEDLA